MVIVKVVNPYKWLRGVPDTICCYLEPEGLYFHTNTLVPELEEESVQTIILGSSII